MSSRAVCYGHVAAVYPRGGGEVRLYTRDMRRQMSDAEAVGYLGREGFVRIAGREPNV